MRVVQLTRGSGLDATQVSSFQGLHESFLFTLTPSADSVGGVDDSVQSLNQPDFFDRL